MSLGTYLFQRRTKTSRRVYDFLPSQKLVHLSGYFKHHFSKTCTKSSKPFQPFFWLLAVLFCAIYIFLLMRNRNLSLLLSNITQAVVNFPKTCTKSSKPFWSIFGYYLAVLFFVPSTGCPINIATRSTLIFSFCISATAKVKPLLKSLDPNL